MEEIRKFKDIKIDGKEFRIGLLSAPVGCWLLTHFQAKTYLQEDIFFKLHAYCMEACMLYVVNQETQSRIPTPIYERDRGWTIPSLATNLFVSERLFKEVVDFNLEPFFVKLAEQAVDAARSGIVQPHSPKESAPISGDPSFRASGDSAKPRMEVTTFTTSSKSTA